MVESWPTNSNPTAQRTTRRGLYSIVCINTGLLLFWPLRQVQQRKGQILTLPLEEHSWVEKGHERRIQLFINLSPA